MSTAEIFFYGGLAVSALAYLLLQLDHRAELIKRCDSER